ncbi:MAG: Fic family protein, partial [Candidatus Gracilibacteria bacterium]|nr:Fic family protein [Candidatus Gracilibacteria bacterium]
MEKQEILNIVSKILKIKFDSKTHISSFELEKAKKDFEIQVAGLTNYIFENYGKTDYLNLDFIKGLHKLLYPEGTTIKTYRDGKYYTNLVGEYRLHENTHEEDNHHHSYQKNIESDLINYINHYNSIKDKKRIDILRYYFDFLRVHPFADSNGTIISIICELEFFKYGLTSLDFLKTRFEDGKFLYYFIYEYENNKNIPGILEKIEKMIDDFHDGKLSEDIIEKKEQIDIKTTSELFLGKDKKINFDNTPYFIELNQSIEDNFINISENLPDYDVRKIVYTNTLSYLKNALLRNSEEKHQLVFNGYSSDTERIINFCQKKIISNPFFKLSSNIIKELHKTLYPNGFIQKNKDING